MLSPLLHTTWGPPLRHSSGVSGWDVELLFASDSRERRALANDRANGVALRVRHGVSVLAADVAGLTPEEKHVVAARALVAVSTRPLRFSHWTAAVIQGTDVLRHHLGRLHVTFAEPGARGLEKVVGHVFALDDREIEERHGLLVTSVARTVLDIAGSGTFADGVVAADSALRNGLPREELEAAIELAGPRRAARRIRRVVDFADGLSGSAGESVSRVTLDAMGIRPVLQREHFDLRGFIGRSDFFFPQVKAVGEFDGRIKFTDPRFAPDGAAAVLWAEKVREDRMRAVNDGFARWGWAEANDAHRLAPVLRAVGLRIHARF